MDYEKQGRDFLTKTGTDMRTVYLGKRKHFPTDTDERDVYSIHLVRGNKSMSIEYGDSIISTNENARSMSRHKPTAYAVLSCLTKYPVDEDVDSFASEYGIEKPSEAFRIWTACKKEFENLAALYNVEELEELRDIQ